MSVDVDTSTIELICRAIVVKNLGSLNCTVFDDTLEDGLSIDDAFYHAFITSPQFVKDYDTDITLDVARTISDYWVMNYCDDISRAYYFNEILYGASSKEAFIEAMKNAFIVNALKEALEHYENRKS
jgi:hypothetical protein